MQKRALVIDDEWDIVDLISASLRKLGLEVAEATNVDQAWAQMKLGEFDLILCDIMMPGKDGIEFLSALKSYVEKMGANRPRIIIVSALASSGASEVRERIKYLGVDLLLGKPWHELSLHRFIRKEILGEITSQEEQSVLLPPVCKAIIDAVSLNTGHIPIKGEQLVRKSGMMFGEFTGVVNVVGERATGLIALSFPRLCLDQMSRFIFQKDSSGNSQSVQSETVAGVVNQFRMRLQDILVSSHSDYQVSAAMIISGSNYKISCQTDSVTCVVPFQWQDTKFFLEVSLESLWLK